MKLSAKRKIVEVAAGFVAFYLALLFVRWLKVPDTIAFTIMGMSCDRETIAFVIISLAFEGAMKVPIDLFFRSLSNKKDELNGPTLARLPLAKPSHSYVQSTSLNPGSE
jgi:hypothetical protein